MNKNKLILIAISFIISTSSFAFRDTPGDVVVCSFSDNTNWEGTASSVWTVEDLIAYCESQNGSASVASR